MVALKLSKSGYGRPDEILKMSSEIVMRALEYEQFIFEYEETYMHLNKEEK